MNTTCIAESQVDMNTTCIAESGGHEHPPQYVIRVGMNWSFSSRMHFEDEDMSSHVLK